MKENYGNLEELKKLGKDKKHSFTEEQLLDENLKNREGESRAEVTKRMEVAFHRVLVENSGKKIAIVSHGAAIQFLLMKWCKLSNTNQLEWGGKTITLSSPGVIKLVFEEKNLISLTQIR